MNDLYTQSNKNSLGIRARIVLLTIVPTLTISLLLGIYFISMRFSDLNRNLYARGQEVTTELVASAEYGLFSDNLAILQEITDSIMSHPDVEVAALYSNSGKLLAHTGQEPDIDVSILQNRDYIQHKTVMFFDHKENIVFIAPVILRSLALQSSTEINKLSKSLQKNKKHRLGWAVVRLSKLQTTLNEYQAVIATFVIAFIGLAVSILFGIRLGRDLSEPLLAIIGVVRRIRDGNMETRVKSKPAGELQILADGINSMAESLFNSQQEMQQNIEQATLDLRETLETIEIQNAELDIARKEALEASQVKSNFLANMSHEIRTPLNGIIGFTDLLLKTKLTNSQKDFIDTIKKSSVNLLKIINDILDFSKIEHGKLELELRSFDLIETIEDSIMIFRPIILEKHLDFNLIIHPNIPTIALGDALRINQIITNLTSNAIKFTSQGSVIIDVMQVALNQGKHIIKFEIKDTGIGMTDKQAKNLFNAFSQADSSTTRKFGGTGLGLVIAKNLIEKMDGEIKVNSTLSVGSIFTFTISLLQCNSKIEIYDEQFFQGMNAILLRDSSSLVNSLQPQLIRYGFDLQVMTSENQLIDKIIGEDEDYQFVILCYMSLPDANRLKSRLIVDINNFSKAKILVVANDTNDNLIRFIKLIGADAYLANPYRISDLWTTLEQAYKNGIIYESFIPEAKEYKSLPSRENNDLGTHLKTVTVLIVDDNEINLKLLATMLKNMGICVHQAKSGFEAIAIASEFKLSMVIMDIQMPEMDGIEACANIKKIVSQRNTPIIALSADVLGDQEEFFKAKGFDDYKPKPINELEIEQLMKKWVKNKQTNHHVTQNVFEKSKIIESKNLQIIDLELGAKLAAGSRDTAHEMLTILVNNLENDKPQFLVLYEKESWLELTNLVHKLHGGCCYCGVPYLRKITAEFEKQLKSTDCSKANIAKMYYDFIKAIEKTIAKAQELL